MNDAERTQWVENDEGLYLWWQGEGGGLWAFVRDHRAEITAAINDILNRPPSR